MDLAIVGNRFPPRYGGVEIFAINVARELAALGHTTTLLCAGGAAPRIMREGTLETRVLWSFDAVGMPIAPSLLKAIPREADCVHATMPSPLGPLAAIAWSMLHDRPLVVSLLSFPTRYGPLSRSYNQVILPRIIMAASVIVTPSRDFLMRSALSSLFVDLAWKTERIPIAVDLEVFRPDRKIGSQTREAYKLPKRTILFVGVLDGAHWYKGLEYLLEAMKEVRKNVDVHLLVVGDGDRRIHFERLTERLGLGSNVSFVGSFPDRDLPRFYNTSDCLVMPSVSHTESFGIVLAEAMACGTPVIASDVGGLSDTVGDAGFLVQPRDVNALSEAITRLLTDSDLRARAARRCLERARLHFSWKKVALQYEAVYRQLVGG